MNDELKAWLECCLEDVLSGLESIKDLSEAAFIVNRIFDIHRKRILENEHVE